MRVELFLTTLEQVAVLLFLIFVGYFFRRKEIITEGGKRVLAKLLTYLFAPCYSIMSLSSVINVKDLSDYAIIFLCGIFVTSFFAILARPLAKIFFKDKVHRNILNYAFTFGNIGYFGYPVIAAVFGAEMRAMMMIFCLPMSVLIYTYGYYILTADIMVGIKKRRIRWRERLSFLWSPMMLGAIVGVASGLITSGFNVSMPSVVTKVLEAAGNCQSAPAMLLTGAVLAAIPIKKLFTAVKPYLIALVRLLLLPVIICAIFYVIYLFGVRGEMFLLIFRLSVIVSALPVGMNTVIFPEAAGHDSTEGAKACFSSYVLALACIPVVYMFMDMLVAVMV